MKVDAKWRNRLGYLAVILIVFLVGYLAFWVYFAVNDAYTRANRSETNFTNQQTIISKQNEALTKIDQQNELVICQGSSTNQFALDVTDLLVAEVNADPNRPERTAAIEQLKANREKLRQAQVECLKGVPAPPMNSGLDPSTTSTTQPG